MRKCLMCGTNLGDDDETNIFFIRPDRSEYIVCNTCAENIKNVQFRNSKHFEEAKEYLREKLAGCGEYDVIIKVSKLPDSIYWK